MKKIRIILVLILTLMVITGCSASLDTSGDVGIKGIIKSVSSSQDPIDIQVAILVEGTVEDNLGLVSDKASVSLTKDTVLVSGSDKKYFELSDLGKLTVGLAVEVIFTGPVAESYPVQGEAKVLIIGTLQ